MARRGLNKPIVTKGVQIVGGIQSNAGVGGSSMTTPGESNGTLGELVHVTNTIASDWNGIRYFAVDYDGGSDEAKGFSDVDMPTAGTVALKTIEELVTRLPKLGQANRAVVAIKARAAGATYLKKDGVTPDRLNLNGIYGYLHLLVRGTGTVATAGATAFANDTADKIALGAQIVAGTNAGGYNPVAPITINSFNVQLNGGGAPGLASEPGLIGKRIRFNSTTTTVALRNATAMIHANGTANIVVADDLPAVPVAADIFYIEEPGTAVDAIYVTSSTPNATSSAPSFSLQGIHIAGFKTTDTGGGTGGFIYGSAAFAYSFIDSNSVSVSGATSFNIADFADVRITRTYTDETGTTITTGVGVRGIGLLTAVRGDSIIVTSSALVSSTLGRVQAINVLQATCGSGCYFFAGVLYQGVGIGVSGIGTVVGNLIGRGNTAIAQRLRVLAAIAVPIAGISIATGDCDIQGCDITGMGTSPLMVFRGVGQSWAINDVVGSTGNTGVGMDLTLSKDGHFSMGIITANTFTATALKDIMGAPGGTSGPFYVHADYARTDLRDDAGNHIQGTAGSIVGTTTIATNDGNANIGQYKLVRPTASGVVRSSIATTAATSVVVGITQSAATAAGPQATMLVNGGGSWVQFDGAPSAGDIAYLSTTNAGNAQNTAPVLSGTNQLLAIGRVLRVSGTLGFINFDPDITSSLANGSASSSNFFNTQDISASQAIVNGITYLVDTSGGAINLTLPAATRNAYFLVKDKTGNSDTNNITIVRAAAEKIENVAADKILATPFFMETFVSNGTDWFMV